MTIKPRQPVPPFEVDIVGGGRWRLSEQAPRSFTMIVVYRGLHCPICKGYLADLDRRLDALDQRGVGVVAASSDGRDRAERAKADWGLDRLTLGYGLGIDAGRKWGLYVSGAIREGEPTQFLEPGLFLVRPDRTLYWASIQTMPFARPRFDDVVAALDTVLAKNYPARGEA